MADALKKANAESKSLMGENKSLCADLEEASKKASEQDLWLAAAEEKIRSLEARLVSAEATAEAFASATESAKQACYTLRLALNDLGARAEGVPGDNRTTFDFSEWTQEAAGSIVEVAGAYGDCCARVSLGFVLSVLHEHGCDHVEDFPELVKEVWPGNSQCSRAALRAFRKDFLEDGGRDCVKTQLRENIERMAKGEEASAADTGGDPGPSKLAAQYEGGGDGGQDHPEV